MEMEFKGAVGIMALFIAAWGLFVTVFWMVVGWRAMRAHEELADQAKHVAWNTQKMDAVARHIQNRDT